jgi:hypothetical protein
MNVLIRSFAILGASAGLGFVGFSLGTIIDDTDPAFEREAFALWGAIVGAVVATLVSRKKLR